MEEAERTYRARSYGAQPTMLTARVVVYGRPARAKRAVGIAAPLFVGGIASVLIPGFHFVTVPGLLGASFLFGRKRWRHELDFQSMEGPCPSCAAPLSVEPPAELGAIDPQPVRVLCAGCGEFLTIEPA